jgi:hypothetical protein
MAQEWNLKTRGTACTACQAVFADGQEYFTRLVFHEHDYVRGDFCSKCWSEAATREPGYSSWKGLFRAPPAEPDRRIRKETAESLLRERLEKDDPAQRNVIYILAVMLERQRVLVERGVRTEPDGRRVVVYEHRKTGESLTLTDPQLKLSELEPLQREIMALLTGGGGAPGGGETPAK